MLARVLGVSALVWLGTILSVATATEPTISNLTMRGLTTGGTTRLVLVGTNLLPEPRLVLPVPIARQTVHPDSKPDRVTIDVTLDATTPGGLYQAWLATAKGVSSPFTLSLDPLPNIEFAESIERLPIALNGVLRGAQIFETRLTGRAGQRVVVEVESRRLGSALKPVLHLYDARRVQLEWAQGASAIFGDARLEAILPSDGTYYVELHDALFRGASPGNFRLKLGDLQFVDLVYPLGVRRGEPVALEFLPAPRLGTLPGDLPGELPLPWSAPSGARPRVITSDLDEVLEQPAPDGTLQTVVAPAAVNGRLAQPREVDRYRLQVKPGQRLRFDLLAERAGSPVDGVMRLVDESGKQLAENDDRPGTTDPGFDFTVPKAMESAVVEIRDLNGRGGSYYIYRLAVTELGRPDFTLALLGDAVSVPAGQHAVVAVRATRQGYSGPIRITCQGLPPGVIVSGDEIPAGATDTLLTLAAGSETLAAAVARLVGESVGQDPPLRRPVLAKETPSSQYQPWLRQYVATAVSQPSPLELNWQAVSTEASLPLGSTLATRLAVERRKVQGPVRVTLLTSQIMPTKKVAGPAVRGRPGPQQTVDDVDRAIRLAGDITIAADQETADVAILAPGDLADIPYDVALRCELLSPDGKRVLATAFSDVWRLRTSRPFRLELANNQVQAKAGLGDAGKIVGRVIREPGFDKPVTVALERLPEELVPPRVEVPADASEFELLVAFQYPAPLGKLATARIVGAAQVAENIVVRSADLPVTIDVTRGAAPPALLPLFEDEAEFAEYFTEGDARATVETADRYTGPIALRAEPTQAVRKKLPGLGYKIAENPGPGEYRYVRFAWKKPQGQAIVLQFYSGNFQVERVVTSATTAYEAGTGSNRLRIPTLRIAEQLPSEWVVVTRDLYADFGEFTLTGLGLIASDGGPALFDHIYLAQNESDFAACPQPAAAEPTVEQPATPDP